MIVIDASAALDLLLRTPAAAAIQVRVQQAGQDMHAPHLIDVEITQVLRKSERLGVVTPDRCREALADWLAFPVVRHAHDLFLMRVWELRHNISAYDAVYVALAETLGVPLLTRDKKLASAAGHRARIELV